MREIKFRFWNKKLRTMQYPFDRTYFDFKADPLDLNDKLWVLKVYEDECEAMQYTGLKDKNGKEIYEGDIVQTWFSETVKGNLAVIKYLDKGFCQTQSEDDEAMDCVWFYIIEVIGNIYETPELLTNN